MESQKVIAGLLFIGIVIGLFIVTRKSTGTMSTPIKLLPAGTLNSIDKQPTRHEKHYENEEVWDIDWNEDGLPRRVTIHRNATQT